jgi:hypothetical protein
MVDHMPALVLEHDPPLRADVDGDRLALKGHAAGELRMARTCAMHDDGRGVRKRWGREPLRVGGRREAGEDAEDGSDLAEHHVWPSIAFGVYRLRCRIR